MEKKFTLTVGGRNLGEMQAAARKMGWELSPYWYTMQHSWRGFVPTPEPIERTFVELTVGELMGIGQGEFAYPEDILAAIDANRRFRRCPDDAALYARLQPRLTGVKRQQELLLNWLYRVIQRRVGQHWKGLKRIYERLIPERYWITFISNGTVIRGKNGKFYLSFLSLVAGWVDGTDGTLEPNQADYAIHVDADGNRIQNDSVPRQKWPWDLQLVVVLAE
ncbi:MAG TPA: hypothetical protein VGE59_02375 [Patescibacteria group bacterium]